MELHHLTYVNASDLAEELRTYGFNYDLFDIRRKVFFDSYECGFRPFYYGKNLFIEGYETEEDENTPLECAICDILRKNFPNNDTIFINCGS